MVSLGVTSPTWTATLDILGNDCHLHLGYTAQTLTGQAGCEEIDYEGPADRYGRKGKGFLETVECRDFDYVRLDYADAFRTRSLNWTVIDAAESGNPATVGGARRFCPPSGFIFPSAIFSYHSLTMFYPSKRPLGFGNNRLRQRERLDTKDYNYMIISSLEAGRTTGLSGPVEPRVGSLVRFMFPNRFTGRTTRIEDEEEITNRSAAR